MMMMTYNCRVFIDGTFNGGVFMINTSNRGVFMISTSDCSAYGQYLELYA